ncbi:hypothetical protein ACFWRZ_34290 [Streptomyces rubiginosohelvolus]|uniref:hypothetical protein n=1 Tax=Streptomyces rubiginosohelvolus TaxID=67362 RepID=UPI0036554346
MNSIASTLTEPRAGLADDMTRDDDARGPERDETDRAFTRLVHHLVVEGDDRAASAGRRARRTLQEMIPGYTRQPVLNLLSPPAMEQCPLCLRFNCAGHDCPFTATRPECKDVSDKQDRKDLSDKVRDANKRSGSRPK